MAESRNRAFARLAKDVTTTGNIKEEGISADVTLGLDSATVLNLIDADYIQSNSSVVTTKSLTATGSIPIGSTVTLKSDGTAEAAKSVTAFSSTGPASYSTSPSGVDNPNTGVSCYVPWLDKYYVAFEFPNCWAKVYEVSTDAQNFFLKADMVSNQDSKICYMFADENTKQVFVFAIQNLSNDDLYVFSLQFTGTDDAYSGYTQIGYLYGSSVENGYPYYQWAHDTQYNSSTGNLLIGLIFPTSSSAMKWIWFATDGTAVSGNAINSSTGAYKDASQFSGSSTYWASLMNIPGTDFWAGAGNDGDGSILQVTWNGSLTSAPSTSYKGNFGATWNKGVGMAWDGTDKLYVYYANSNYFYIRTCTLAGSTWSIAAPTLVTWTNNLGTNHFPNNYNSLLDDQSAAYSTISDFRILGKTNPKNSSIVNLACGYTWNSGAGFSIISIDLANKTILGTMLMDTPNYTVNGSTANNRPYNYVFTYNSEPDTWSWVNYNGGTFEVVNNASVQTTYTGDTQPYIGVSNDSAADDEIINVNLFGTVLDNYSGLTVGQDVYVTKAGVITNSISDNYFIGVALDSNEVLMTFNSVAKDTVDLINS